MIISTCINKKQIAIPQAVTLALFIFMNILTQCPLNHVIAFSEQIYYQNIAILVYYQLSNMLKLKICKTLGYSFQFLYTITPS